jgi:hypothetical protein
MVRVSVQHGTSEDSASAYAFWGIARGLVFHRYSEGHRYSEAHRFAKLACDLVEKHGFIASEGKVYLSLGSIAVWTQPIPTVIDFHRKGIHAAIETSAPTQGKHLYAAYSWFGGGYSCQKDRAPDIGCDTVRAGVSRYLIMSPVTGGLHRVSDIKVEVRRPDGFPSNLRSGR